MPSRWSVCTPGDSGPLLCTAAATSSPRAVDATVKLCYRETVKNITVSVDDNLYRLARIRAAERQSTVTALVREFLVRLVEQHAGFEERRRAQNELIDKIRSTHKGFSASDRLTREEVHERREVR